MTLQEYLRILRKRGWIIILSMLLAGLVAYGISMFQQELYRFSPWKSARCRRARTGGWATRPRISCATSRPTSRRRKWPSG
ncbi:MAG: hypothetical protein R2838_12095 [Caldilineaceae bacterium]